MIVITGSGGFIGRNLVDRFAGRGEAVVALDRARPVGGGPVGGVVEHRPLPSADASDADFRNAVRGARHVIHCAGMARAEGSQDALFNANVVLTGKLANAACQEGCGFLHLSSIRAAAERRWSGTITATMEPHPDDSYGKSKLASEIAVADAYGRDSLGRFAVLRLAPVYGPGMKNVLGRLLALAATPWPLPVDDLPVFLPLLSVERLASAIERLIEEDRPVRGTFVVADSRALALSEIVSAFRTGLGRPRRLFSLPGPLARALGARLRAHQDCDTSLLRDLGWQPESDSAGRLAEVAALSARG